MHVTYIGETFYIGVKYMIIYAHRIVYVYIRVAFACIYALPQPFHRPQPSIAAQPFRCKMQTLVGSVDSAQLERIESRIEEIKQTLRDGLADQLHDRSAIDLKRGTL